MLSVKYPADAKYPAITLFVQTAVRKPAPPKAKEEANVPKTYLANGNEQPRIIITAENRLISTSRQQHAMQSRSRRTEA